MTTTEAQTATAAPAIRVTAITFNRAEGRAHECGPRTFTGPDAWRDVERHIMVAARTAPASGGYDKCDVTITFADGFTYRTRYDMVHPTRSGHESLASHVRGTWECYAGRRIPAHLATDGRWERLIETLEIDPAEWAALLDTYAIGEVRS